MSLRRLGRKPKSLAAKGKPGAINRNITVRINAKGEKQDFHSRKGWRRKIDA